MEETMNMLAPAQPETAHPSSKLQHVLITGGAGFIGSHLMSRLAPGCRVTLLDNFHRNALRFAEQSESTNVSVQPYDVLDSSGLSPLMADVDCVFHLAAIAGVSSYYAQPSRTLEVNLLGTMNVVKAAISAGVTRFVYLSTSEVYGVHAARVSETSPACVGPVDDCRWVYAISKLAGEQAVMHLCRAAGLDFTIVRPFNVYGPRQVGEGAISNFCASVAAHKPLVVYGDGTAIRAWCYISDFLDGLLALSTAEAGRNNIFNIGNPFAIESSIGLAERVRRLAGGGEVERKPIDRVEVEVRVPTIERVRAAVGYEPRVGLDEGIRETLAWARVNLAGDSQ
jgi:nucleoside-diphosphate-sugar epimerase